MNNNLNINTGPIFSIFFLETTIKPIIFPKKPIKTMIGGNRNVNKKINNDISELFFTLNFFFFNSKYYNTYKEFSNLKKY